MPCYHPVRAYRTPGGTITFKEGGDSGSALDLPCGRCIGCRIQRTQQWALRCMHEAAMHDANSFITLTYGENCDPSLNYHDFQKFLKALRRTTPIRFFAAGEYGALHERPHWHALIFGHHFDRWHQVSEQAWASHQLANLWPHGHSSTGDVTQQSAAYVASYCIKKITGPLAKQHYERVNLATGEIFQLTPEMARMSLKPGIGATYFDRYKREIYYARDGCVQPGGKTLKPPRYYDKRLAEHDIKQACEIETNRILDAQTRQEDNTPDRLNIKEHIALERQKQKQRKL